jgi:uncharacterized membrane protein YqjE
VRGVIGIVRTTGALFGFELRQAARLVGARLIVLSVALTLVVSGVAISVAALALWLGSVMGATWMGFAVVGGAAVLVGAAVMTWAARNLRSHRDLRFPATREQIGRDVEWLDKQVKGDEQPSSGV